MTNDRVWPILGKWRAPEACGPARTRPVFRLLLCLVSLLIGGCETFDSSYDTYAQALAANQVAKGWIPAWVPERAIRIREVHNLDSNASALVFELPRDTALAIPSDCRRIGHEESLPVAFSRSWWPEEGELGTEYAFFRCRDEAALRVFVAVRHDGRRVLHWRTHAHA